MFETNDRAGNKRPKGAIKSVTIKRLDDKSYHMKAHREGNEFMSTGDHETSHDDITSLTKQLRAHFKDTVDDNPDTSVSVKESPLKKLLSK